MANAKEDADEDKGLEPEAEPGADLEDSGKPESAGEPEPEGSSSSSSRMDSVKAFFRALHAGEDITLTQDGKPLETRNSATGQLTASEAEYLQEQLEEFERRTAEAENLYKRMAADFDNYRRRVDREREEFANLGAQRVLETMLPALDDMDRAVQNLSEEMEPDKLLEGIRIVTSRIMSCLEQAGIKPLKAVGEQFDPYFHEPVQQVKTSKHPDGSVVDELRKGYTLNNKVVRPALVTVASNPGETEAGGSPAQETEVLGPAAAGAAGKGSEASGKKSKGVSGQVESSPDASSEAGEDGC